MTVEKALTVYPSLQGQRVFVTGGGTGIGAAIVMAFAQQGAQVAFVDVAEKESAALAHAIAEQGFTPVWWRTCDVCDVAALQQVMAQAQEALGDFGTLVNNVARDDRHTLESVTPAYWDERMAVNQRPAFFAIQAVVPGMHRLGGGSIINLGSTGWQCKNAGYPVYAVAKSSFNGLTRGLADELGARRIRINTVSPGYIETPMTAAIKPEALAKIRAQIPLGRLGLPSEIARVVCFLCDAQSAYITGANIPVNGGLYMSA